MKHPLAGALALSLVAAACGGSSGEVASDATTETTAVAETTVVTEPVVETTVVQEAMSDEEYCEVAREVDALDMSFLEGDTDDPDFVKAYVEASSELFDSVTAAPPEIEDAFEVSRGLFEELVVAVEANDFDFWGTLPELSDMIESPEVAAAEDAITAFEEAVCGIIDEDDSDESDNEASAADIELFVELMKTEGGRQALAEQMSADSTITEEQALCFLETVDPETFASVATLPEDDYTAEMLSDLMGSLATCDIPLEDFTG